MADELHTILVFPHDWLVKSGFVLPENFKCKEHVAVSWGGRQAMIKEAELNSGEILAALYLPGSTVMECAPVDRSKVEAPDRFRVWTKESVPADRGPFVAAFLNHSVVRDSNGKPNVVTKSNWGDGMLLESPHTNNFPKMCNSWTNQAMTAAGTKVSPIMAIFPESVIGAAQRDGHVIVREALVEDASTSKR